MRYDNEHGIQALYNIAAEYPYQEHWFSTIRRDFVADPMLQKPKSEFKMDTTFVVSVEGFEPSPHGPKP
jgi:hypothetical protein